MTTPPYPTDAIEHLRDHQEQLDEDGVIVGVSRQAIDEVLTYLAMLSAAPPATDGELEAALRPLSGDPEPAKVNVDELIDELICAAQDSERQCHFGRPGERKAADQDLVEARHKLTEVLTTLTGKQSA